MRVVDTSAWIEWLLGDAALAFSNTSAIRQLETDVAVEAADYAARHSLALADAIIYATPMKSGADLLTCDAHFANLPNVVYFAETPSP